MLFGDPPEDQTLSRIIQYRFRCKTGFLKNPVGQSPKAQYINIHDPLFLTGIHQVKLGLHGKLIGNKKQKAASRLLFRPCDDISVKPVALSTSGRAKIKLQCHFFCTFL